jgi:signal peptidase II
VQRIPFLLLTLLVVALDQLTKFWIVKAVMEDSELQIIPRLLYITHTTNTGGAFGVFQHSPLILAATALFVVLGIAIYLSKANWPVQLLLGVGLALPLAGAIGNLIDRIRLGFVVDFIEVRLGSYTWPIFNVADSAICIGVAVLAVMAATAPTPSAVRQEEISG